MPDFVFKFEPDSTNTDVAKLKAIYNQAVESGDWEAVRQLLPIFESNIYDSVEKELSFYASRFETFFNNTHYELPSGNKLTIEVKENSLSDRIFLTLVLNSNKRFFLTYYILESRIYCDTLPNRTEVSSLIEVLSKLENLVFLR